MPNKPSPETKVSASDSSANSSQGILVAAKGGGILFVGDLFVYAVSFFTNLILARFLGASQFGLYKLSLTVVAVTAGLALLGLQSAMVRYVALYAARRDEAGLWGTLQVGLGGVFCVSIAMGSGLFFFANPIAEIIFREPELAPQLRIVSLILPFLSLGTLLSNATRGFKKMQYSMISKSIVEPTLKLLLIVLLAITIGLNASSALIIYSISVVASFFFLLYFLHNNLFSLKRSFQAARRDVGELYRFALPVYLSNLINIFGNNIQTMLLGALSTVTSVGIFTIAFQVNSIGRLFHGAIVASSGPVISELYDQGNLKQMGALYGTATKWTFTLNLPFFLIMVLFPEPILSIFGQSFTGGVAALVILAWANIVRTGTGICGLMINMTGNTKYKLINSIVMFVLTLGLNMWLIPDWGLMGAAIAALAADTMVNLLRLAQVFILFRLQPYDLSYLKPIVAGLVSLVVIWSLSSLIVLWGGLIYLAINSIILLSVYAAVIFMLGLSQEDHLILSRTVQRARFMLGR